MLKIVLHRPRVNLAKVLQASGLLFIVVSLFYGFHYYAAESRSDLGFEDAFEGLFGNGDKHGAPEPPFLKEKEGNATLLALAPDSIKVIMDPDDNSSERVECPRIDTSRYGSLRQNPRSSPKQYFFALDLHQNADLLPRLIGSIVEVVRFLGPDRCTLSIVEGGSDDGTFEILKLLRENMTSIGLAYHFISSEIDSRVGDRIKNLAELRNLALSPLVHGKHLAETTVLFLNDVAICPDEILELALQLVRQGADMTCAMDWAYVGPDPTFYDLWIARQLNGDTFFELPADGNYNSAWNLFWNDEATKVRYSAHKPFQVFSCWDGAVAFKAEVLNKVKFRSSKPEECPVGEPTLFCKDLWAKGYGKIAVVPSVNLVYYDWQAKKITQLKGFVSNLVQGDENDEKIKWVDEPPEKVKCMRGAEDQRWEPWDQGL